MVAELEQCRGQLAAGSPADALAGVDALPERVRGSLAVQEVRLECLMALGRFEMAASLAEQLLGIDPENPVAARHRLVLAYALRKPELAAAVPGLRPFHSDIPREVLLRIQQVVHHTTYRGLQMVKDPFSMGLYPMLLAALRPRTVIEIGSKAGGSALWFADLLASLRIDGQVHSIDVIPVMQVAQANVTFHEGNGRRLASCLGPEFLATLPRPLLVVEDADHTRDTSLAVLEFFHPHLRAGEYIVIEDGILSDLYPEIFPGYSSGPHLALRDFLTRRGAEYVIDPAYCDFYGYNATWASNGFLRKIV
jgi:cephalosporin hydroxylase